MKHYRKNFSRRQPKLSDGDELVECNCSQYAPGTPFGAGLAKLRFARCNLVNCVLPEDAETIDCNTAQVDLAALDAAEAVQAQKAEAERLLMDKVQTAVRTAKSGETITVDPLAGTVATKAVPK